MIDYKELYEVTLRENLTLKKLLDKANDKLDELNQLSYTGTGSDYLDCVLGIGGFDQYGPVKGVKGLT